MMERAKTFVFGGLLTSQLIRDLRASGQLRSPDSTPTERRDHDLFVAVPERIRAGSIEMQRCYRLVFVFENLARDFIITRFTESDGVDWFERRATATMKKKVEDRRADEEKNHWHTGRNRDAIYYLDFGDLDAMIKNHWDVFKDFFGSQIWVSSRLQELERSRNVIAHTNLLSAGEVDRLEMYLRDWLRQVG